LLVLGCFISVWFSWLSNYFEFNVTSWSTLKYYCPQSINVIANYWSDSFTTFENNIKFNSWFLSLTHSSISPTFPSNQAVGTSTNIYYTEWRSSSAQSSNVTTNTFTINTLNINFASTELEFVTRLWSVPTYLQSGTADKITLREPAWTYDTLVWVNNATYNFEAYPCDEDTNAPIVYNNLLNSPAVGGHFLWTGIMTWLIIDWIASNWHYWYKWIKPLDLDDYTAVWSSGVDNQYGVNSGTISVKIDNSNASAWFVEYPVLNITNYVWWETPNEYTWNSEKRWYYIEFKNDDNNIFDVEKPVTITITWYDNFNHVWSRYLMTKTFSFNPIVPPDLSPISPANTSSFINPATSFIKFEVTDDWAGVDTGKISITILEVFSGWVSLMSWHTYTSLDMIFSGISWGPLLGNSWWYDVTIQLDSIQQPLVADSQIRITGFVVDLAWNTWYLNLWDWDFTTRPDCSFYGCNEILDIYIMWWLNNNGRLPYQFTWQLLIATWTNPNSPYPYITWANNDILMCWFPWTGAVLGGNVDVVDSAWSSITWTIYTWNELYITWLDFTYDSSAGIITIQ